MKFWLNPDIDLTQLRDSMQIDSNQEIATLSDGIYRVSLEVRGDVKVYFDDVYYDAPSVFPEELKVMIADDEDWFNNPRVLVEENNWFEVFYGTEDFPNEHYDVVDVEGDNPVSILALLIECIDEMRNEPKGVIVIEHESGGYVYEK